MTSDKIDQFKILHHENPGYASRYPDCLPEVCLIIDLLKPRTVLDFGCGKGSLLHELVQLYPKIEFYGYDPAIPGRDNWPDVKIDLVVGANVLENIPEDALPKVLERISAITENTFFVVHHALAETVLTNGDNAHCTVKPPIWYYNLFSRYFKNPYPLPGRSVALSAMITFFPTVDFLADYHRIVCPPVQERIIERIVERIVERPASKFIPRPLGLFISAFIPKKKNRRRFREKYVKGK